MTNLKCPKCGKPMKRKTSLSYLDPFEIAYYCTHCESTYVFHSWEEYYDACNYEEMQKQKAKVPRFNPSRRNVY